MKKYLLLSFIVLALYAKGQNNYSCVDTTRINIYHSCTEDYQPVCGCDGKTYRNLCAAYNWGGINPYFSNSTIQGPCGAFDFDFVPNPIVPGSINSPGRLSVYVKGGPVQALIQFYDIWGRVWRPPQLGQALTIPDCYNTNIAWEQDVDLSQFPQGIYYIFVTINGVAQYKKIVKTNLE